MQPIASQKLCETCGASLDLEAPSGFCLSCLLSTALETEVSDSPSTGARFGDFEILEEIARGGMGIVYRARQRVPARIVALKMILPAHIDSAEAIMRFRAEAEAAASLDHEHILPIYSVGEKDGAPFYSMKLAEGGNLSARIRDFAEALRQSAALVAALARAVQHAHEHGILHRDLKPGNILFDGAGKPFVSDFGLAKWLERTADLTQTLAILGTPYYMAPEQAAGSHSLTAATDVYSLGAILFHLLTGRVPFRGDNALDVLRQAAERPAPRPRALNRKIPPDLETICLKCLEKNSSARYPSAAALAEDLDRFLTGRTILARRAGPVTHVRRWIGRNRVIAILSAAAAALLISLLLVLAVGRDGRSTTLVDSPKSIAVLPFENLSDDKSNDYFVSGLHDELLVDLGKIGELKVIARTSVQSYKDTPRNMRDIGATLGVKTVLQGNVRRAGKRARINVQLIDTQTETQIWAESFERELDDLFAAQSELALRIAAALQAKLSPAEKAAIEMLPTRDAEAYDLFLRAKESIYSRRTRGDEDADIRRAMDLLDQAIARDPNFALAYAFLAQLDLMDTRSNDDPNRLERARARIEKSLSLSPDLGEARMARGIYFYKGIVDLERARAEFKIARSLLPNNAECLAWSGLLERRLRHWKEALGFQVKAADLDPRDGAIQRSLLETYYAFRQWGEAERTIERAIIVSPQQTNYFRMKEVDVAFMKGDLPAARARLQALPPDFEADGMVAYLRVKLALYERDFARAEQLLNETEKKLGPNAEWWIMRDRAFLAQAEGDRRKAQRAWENARKQWEEDVRRDSQNYIARSLIAMADAALGQKEAAMAKIDEVLKNPQAQDFVDGPQIAGYRALIYAWGGEHEQALEQLAARAKLPSGPDPGDLKFHPRWDALRDDPRFARIIADKDQPLKIE